MDNQHRKIQGYRELTQAEIDLTNKIKAAGETLQALVAEVGDRIDGQYATAVYKGDLTVAKRIESAAAHRWKALAKDHLQQGLMCLTRAVAQPTTF